METKKSAKVIELFLNNHFVFHRLTDSICFKVEFVNGLLANDSLRALMNPFD